MSTLHPDFSKLAARISISNLHKNTLGSFSENVKILRANVHPRTKEPAPLVSETFYNTVMKNAKELDAAVVYSRDFEYDYFGYKTLERSYLLRVNDKVRGLMLCCVVYFSFVRRFDRRRCEVYVGLLQ